MNELNRLNIGMVNVFLIKGKKNILIDTGTKDSYKKIIDKLNEFEINPESIDLIILTHSHNDHVGSLDKLVKITKAKCLMSRLEYEDMKASPNILPRGTNVFGKIISSIHNFTVRKNSKIPIIIKPNILIENDYDLKDFGIKGKVIITPGHTIGSVSVVVGNKAVIGDNLMDLFSKNIPKKPFIAWNILEIKNSLRKLLSLEIEEFYFSHGNKYTDEDIIKAIEKI